MSDSVYIKSEFIFHISITQDSMATVKPTYNSFLVPKKLHCYNWIAQKKTRVGMEVQGTAKLLLLYTYMAGKPLRLFISFRLWIVLASF